MMQSPYNDAFLQQKLRKMSKAQNLGAVSVSPIFPGDHLYAA